MSKKLLAVVGGHHPGETGATHGGYEEDDLNLVLSKRVAYLLDADLIRKEGEYLTLNQRADRIRNKFEYCLSIHLNAGGGSGIECIPSVYSSRGKKLANNICNELADGLGLKIRPYYLKGRKGNTGDYYYMHRATGSTTTIIVEALFLDKDYKYLNIETIAQAIANGFKNHISEIDPPKEVKQQPNYYKIAQTEIIEVDPTNLNAYIIDQQANKIEMPNFVNGGYFGLQANGKTYCQSIVVSDGVILYPYATHGKPVGTFIVYKDGKVDVKPILDIRNENNVKFAISGCSILPEVRMKEEDFTGMFADIGRITTRPVLGWNSKKKKVILAVRPNSNIARGQLTLKNLGCTKGITLDAGGSTNLKVDGENIFSTSRRINSIITW